MQEIKVTKHAIEEYLNDNPKEKEPERKLTFLFMKMLSESKKKKAIYYNNIDRKSSIIRYRDQAIVYDNYVIITYYRIINKKLTLYKDKIRSLITNILNGEREKQIELQLKKHRIRVKLREARKELNKMRRTQGRFDVLRKCFNCR